MAEKKEENKKEFHIFISYRVSSDAVLAEQICDKIQQHCIGPDARCRFTCFFDKQSLRKGEAWKDQFLAAVGNSCLFLPLLSPAALSCFLEENFKEDWADNLLLEFEKAIYLHEDKQINIFPLFVGNLENGAYQRFNQWGGYSKKKHLGSVSPAETLAKLFGIQGSFVNPDEISEKIPIIATYFEERVWCRYRHRWFKKDNLGPETQHECVQCGEMYLESQNGDLTCHFHEQARWGKYPCCNSLSKGCTRQRHRREHHNDYIYEKKGTFVWSIMGYTNTHESKLEVVAENLEGSDISVDIGITLGVSKYANKLYVKAGDWFSLLGQKDFDFEQAKIASGDDGVLHKKERKDGCSLSVSWFSPPKEAQDPIFGLKVTCRSPSSEKECIGEATFQWQKTKQGVVVPICLSQKITQQGNFREKKLQKPHDISFFANFAGDMIQEVEPLSPDAKPEDIYHTEDTNICVKTNGKITANSSRSVKDRDFLYWPITVINYTSNPVLLTGLQGQWAHYGEAMKDIDAEIVVDDLNHHNSQQQPSLPLRLDPLTPQNLVAKLAIINKEKEKLSFAFFDCAWIAATSPLLLSLSLSLSPSSSLIHPKVIANFINPHRKLDHTKKKDALFWMFLDNLPLFERKHLSVTYGDSSKGASSGFKVAHGNVSMVFNKKELRKICLQARKENTDTVPLPLIGDVEGTALVDRKAGIVYAFHFQGENGYMKMKGVYPLPAYYGTEEDTETVEPCFPHKLALNSCQTGWKPFPEEEVPFAVPPPLDTSLYIPSPSHFQSSSSSSSSSVEGLGEMMGILEKLNNKMDQVLGRMGALEAKVYVLTDKVNDLSQK